jgi:DNA adenine methylase
MDSATPKTTVSPINPAAPYLGGKRNLAKRICQIIDADDHLTYAEPFVGMGGIFLRRRRQPRAEFINDRSQEIYTLFRILQEHYVAFLDLLRFQITTQSNFERLVRTEPATLTDLQRAARFLFLQRTAFGGKVSGRNFGISADRPARFNLTTLEPDLEALHSRLAGVTVTCMDCAVFIDRIDRSETLFYLDPPYWGNEDDYGKGMWSREDFTRLAEQLASIKGRFLLSINDNTQVRQTFDRFTMTPLKTSYSIANRTGATAAGELLISNFAW